MYLENVTVETKPETRNPKLCVAQLERCAFSNVFASNKISIFLLKLHLHLISMVLHLIIFNFLFLSCLNTCSVTAELTNALLTARVLISFIES
jgi:hypothetical protein